MDHLLGSSQHFKDQAATAVADFFFRRLENKLYRFRKLIHSSTITIWHVFFSGLALAR